MAIEPSNPVTPQDKDFWHFACRLYDRPDLRDELLHLQDEGGWDIALLFYAGWRAAVGACLAEADWHRIDQATGRWRRDYVATLRRLRRSLRGHADTDVQALRETIKQSELQAEQILYAQMNDLPLGTNLARDWVQCVTDNIASYARYRGCQPPDISVLIQNMASGFTNPPA